MRTGPIRILHLDDNPTDGELVEFTLKREKLPCTIHFVSTKQTYIEALARKDFDIILSDFRMPGNFDGDEAFVLAKAACPEIPFILVTGELGEEFVIERLKRGITDYVLKDNLKRLVPAVERAMREARMGTQHEMIEAELHESREQYRIVAETATDSIITIDTKSIILFANPATEHIFGYQPSEIIGKSLTLLMPDYLRKLHEKALDRYVETGKRHIRWDGVELQGLTKDGKVIPVEVSFGEYKNNGRQIFTGIIRNISDRKLTEERLKVQHAVTHLLAGATELREVAPQIIQAICEITDWQLGAIWEVDRDASLLRCVDIWNRTKGKFREFVEKSRARTFDRGIGLPGRVWATGTPMWIPDVTVDGNFPRAPIAIKEGLRAAFAFPIMLSNEVLGVIEFFSPEIRQPKPAFLEMIASLGAQIGQFIERKHTEAVLRVSETRFRSMVDQLPFSIQIVDSTGKTLRVNRAWEKLWGVTLHELKDYNLLQDQQLVDKGIMPGILSAFKGEIVEIPPMPYIPDRGEYQGQERWTSSTIYPVLNETGTIREVVLVHQDMTDWKRRELELRNREKELTDFFQNAVIGLHWVGEDGTILWANQAELDMLGYSKEEYIGQKVLRFHVNREAIDALLRMLSEGKDVRNFEAQLYRKDGSIIDVLISSNGYFQNGKFQHTRCFTKNVTDQKRAERILRTRQNELELIIQSTPFMLTRCSRDLRYLFVSPAYARMVGRTVAEFTGKPIGDIMGKEGFDTLRPYIDKVLRGERVEFEATVPFVHVGERLLHVIYVPERNENDEVTGWVGSIVDITERRQAEETSAYLASIVTSSADAIMSKTLDGIVTSWNKGAEQIFGYTAEEMIGQPITRLFPPDRIDEEERILARLRLGERIDHFETIRVTKNNRKIDVSLTISPIRDKSGKIIGASKIVRDITEQKRTEGEIRTLNATLEQKVNERTQQLAAANKELEAFSYSVAHDLRAPLRAIGSFAQRLSESGSIPNLNQQEQRYLSLIGENVQRMNLLIEEILKFSRLGRKEIRETSIDMKAVFRSVIEEYLHGESDRVIDIQLSDLPSAHADPILIRQVVENLISNAVKFTRTTNKPHIEIGTVSISNGIEETKAQESSLDFAIYYVKDNGAGFEMEYAQKLFTIFERLHSEKEFEGTGVGLAFTKRIIERHGGTIWAESGGISQGATFYFSLPIPRSHSQ